MDETKRAELHEKGLREDIKAYAKLKKLSKNEELAEFLNLLIKTAAQKMVWAFTADNVKNWDDFCKVRGEVTSYLYPIQEIRGAEAMEKHLKEQLDRFYKSAID